MRNFPLLLLCGILLTACVDNDYDLLDIDTDDVTIGNDQSTFTLPLATIRIGTGEIAESGADIRTILDEAKIWLPTRLENDCADIARLQRDGSYLDKLLSDLVTEMASSDAQMRAVTDLIWDCYRNRFSSLLPGNQTSEQFYAAFKSAFRDDATLRGQLSAEIRKLASEYLSDMKIDDMHFEVSGIDLDDDVVDMLADNLDPEGTVDARNLLLLTGTIESQLPATLTLDPRFAPTDITCSVEVDALRPTNVIPEMRVYEADLRQIVDRMDIVIPARIEKYYPGIDFDDAGHPIVIKLKLIKKGGLKLNL